jgi:acetyltransferase
MRVPERACSEADMASGASRDPAPLIDVIALPEGRRVAIRPMLPQDAELQLGFFRGLSAERRYHRFMTPLNELPEAIERRLTAIDHPRHLALLAEIFEDGREIMIGEARYVVDPVDAASCELAIAVADEWQGRGIARLLLAELERQATAAGIRHITADTLMANRAALRFAGRAGYAVEVNREASWCARVEKCLTANGSPTAAPPRRGS